MEHWWKRRRPSDDDVVDLRRIDAVINVGRDAEQDDPEAEPEAEPTDRALEEWERSASLVQYSSNFER